MAELTRRYLVMPLATEAPFDLNDADGAFVLKPWKDPAALRALAVYRDNCYPELARELDRWIRTIEAGPRLRGGVGTRNEGYIKAERAPARAKVRARGRAKPKPRPRKRPKKGRRH